MFEYVFVSSVDAILVLLFSFLCFLLLVKEDSPLRQTMPSEYFNLQEYGKEDQEDEIGLQEQNFKLVWMPVWVWVPGWISDSKIFQKSAAASMCEGASQAGSQVERKTVLYCFNLFIFKLRPKNSHNLSSIPDMYSISISL